MAYGACTSADAGAPARIAYLIGADGSITKAYPKVDAKAFPTEVLSELT